MVVAGPPSAQLATTGGRPPAARVLVVEDDRGLAEAMSASLENEHYHVSVAYDGEDALAQAAIRSFDVVVLDLLLPGIDGYQVCAALRGQCPGIAVLVVSALGSAENILAGFDRGADDYLVKPFGSAELKARLRALVRRGGRVTSARPSGETEEVTVLASGMLSLDLGSKRAWYGGVDLGLRPRERDLLEAFLRRPGLVLTRSAIRGTLWGPDSEVSEGAMDQHISQLRRKLSAAGAPAAIETVYCLGWRLNTEHSERPTCY